MSTTKRGEIAFPPAGEGAYIAFTLAEGEGLEQKYGEDFFEKIELAARNGVLGTMVHCIRIGLKRQLPDGRVERLAPADTELAFHWSEAIPAVLDAVSHLVANCGYEELLARVADAHKKQLADAVASAKEAAETAGVPLSEEALVSALSNSLSGQG